MRILFNIGLISCLLSFVCLNKKVEVINFAQLQEQAESKTNDTLYVVNFWATWCKPCVQEMPFFEETATKFSSQKVKIIYMSLNSLKELPTVEKHIETKNIQNRVFLLNAGNPNDWVDKVDKTWSGSIPATIMYKGGKKVFFKEGEFTQEEINEVITNKNQNK
jgi:thiol-disulfide isomerase/thioredoxin